jgi:hypothetical protein
MARDIWYCELCHKEYAFQVEGLRLIQVRVQGFNYGGIVSWVVCEGQCSKDVKTEIDETIIVLTDEPFKGALDAGA